MQGIEFQIINDSDEAARGIDALAKSLEGLKTSLGSGGGSLSTVAKNIGKIRDAVSGLNTQKLTELGTALEGLKTKTEGLKISSSIANQLQSIGDALNNVPDVAQTKLQALADGLRPLTELGKSNLGSMVNQLGKLPEVITALDAVDIEKFAQQMERLSAAMKPFADEMAKVSSGFSRFPSQVTRAQRGLDRYSSSARTAHTRTAALKTLVGGLTFRKLSQSLAEMIHEATNWDGVSQRFLRAFGPYAQENYEWLQKLNQAMNINVQQAAQYSSIYGTMLEGYGVSQKDAATMAMGYTELTYDIWAGYNDIYTSFEDAAIAVRSAIAGEVEPIRKAGFTIVDSQLKVTAALHGVEYSSQGASEELKSYLRYLTLVDQASSQNLVGTFAAEMNTAEGLIRTLTQQVKSLAQTIGGVFLPVLVKTLPYVQAFIGLINDAVVAIAALFNVQIQPVDFSKSFSTATEGTDEIADGMDDAASSAKKLKSYLMGFDELNVINPTQESSSSASSGLAGGSYDGMFDVDKLWDESVLAQINQQAEELKAKLAPILTLAGLIGAAFLAWKFGPSILSGVKILGELLGYALGRSMALTADATKLAGVLKFAGAAAVIAVIAARFMDLYNNSEKFRTGLERLGEIGGAIFDGIKTVVSDVVENLKQFGLSLLELLPEPVKESILGFFEKVQEWAGRLDLDWKDFAMTVAGIALLFVPGGQLAGAALLGFEAISLGIRGLGSLSDEEFNAMLETVKGVFAGIWEFVKEVLDGLILFISGVFTQDWDMVFTGLSNIAGASLDLIGNLTETLFGVNIVNVVREWFEEHVKPWFSLETWKELGKQALDGLFNGLSNMWERAKNWGSGLLQNVKDVLGIHSPSKEFEEIGAYSVAGLQQGFGQMGTVSEQFRQQLSVMQSCAETFSGAVRTAVEAALSTLVTAMQSTQTAAMSMANGISAAFQNMAEQCAAAVSSVVSGINAIPEAVLSGTAYQTGALGATAWGTATPGATASAAAAPASGLAGSMFVNLQTVGENLVTGFVTGIDNNLPTLMEKIAEMKESIQLSFTELCDSVYQGWDTCLLNMSIRFDTFQTMFMASLTKFSVNFRLGWGTMWRAAGNLTIYYLNEMLTSMEEGLNKAVDVINQLIREFNALALLTGRTYQYLSHIQVPKISYMADGGFLGAGQMFIAREAGPELVGTIGNRTAVVNNDQIVASVAGGVAEANEEQNALLREQNELLRALLAKDTGVRLDGKTLLRSTEKAARQRGTVIMAGGVTG